MIRILLKIVKYLGSVKFKEIHDLTIKVTEKCQKVGLRYKGKSGVPKDFKDFLERSRMMKDESHSTKMRNLEEVDVKVGNFSNLCRRKITKGKNIIFILKIGT